MIYPKPKPKKIQKTLDDLKHENNNKGNESKSTQACSKKIDNIFKSSKKSDIIMKEDKDKKEGLLELSEETKNIMNLILNKKREERLNKISNKENDSSFMEVSEETSSINKKNYFKAKNNNQTDSQSFIPKKLEPPKLSAKTLEIMQKLKEERKNRFDRPDNNYNKFRNNTSLSDIMKN